METIIGNPVQATLADESKSDLKYADRKNKKKKARPNVKVEGAQARDTMAEQVGTKDVSHRSKGFWAIDSANPNAWPGAEEYLSSTGDYFIGVQETKVDTAALADKETTARNIGWSASLRHCCKGVGGGNSAGVAIACGKHIWYAELVR